MKVLIAADYEANYLTIGGIPVHAGPEIVRAAQSEAEELVRALAYEAAEARMKDLGPDAGEAPGETEPPREVVDSVVVPDTSRVLTVDEPGA